MFVCLLKNSRIGWLFFHFDCVTSNLAKIPERQAFIYCLSTFSLHSPDSFKKKKKHDQRTFDRVLTSFVPNWMSESVIDRDTRPRLSRSWEWIYLIEISAPKNFSILALNLYFNAHCRVRPPHCSSSSSTSCPTSKSCPVSVLDSTRLTRPSVEERGFEKYEVILFYYLLIVNWFFLFFFALAYL